jgi:hypothetical protein
MAYTKNVNANANLPSQVTKCQEANAEAPYNIQHQHPTSTPTTFFLGNKNNPTCHTWDLPDVVLRHNVDMRGTKINVL